MKKTISHPPKQLFILTLISFVLLFPLSHSSGAEAPLWSVDDAGQTFAPERVIVKFRENTAASAAANALEAAGVKVVKKHTYTGITVVKLKDPSKSIEQLIKDLSASTAVEYAEPDYIWRIDAFPDDPRFNELWGLHNTGQSGGTVDADIDAPEAWDLNTGYPEIVVAVIDTGVDYNHEDLAANMWSNNAELNGTAGIDDDGNGYVDDIYGIDAYNSDSDPYDDRGHGTHVAGTIGARGNNNIGVAGVNWEVKIMALKFLGWQGSGTTSGAVECLEYVIMMKNDYGVNIMVTSNSWGGGNYSQALYDAIEAARDADILFVAAAGNDSSNNDMSPHYPSNYTLDNVIAVASTDRNDSLSGFSNYGPTSVDLGAPGSSILSTVPGNAYDSKSGTSMATPHVAGAAALILAGFPLYTWDEVKALIMDNVDPLASLAGKVVSGGRLNISEVVIPPGPAILPTAPEAGELFDVGQSIDITWRTYKPESVPDVKLEFSADGGDNYTIIESFLPNVDYYSMTAPDVESDQCVIRISDALDGDPAGTTDEFSIHTLSYVSGTVTTPDNGSDVLGKVHYSGPISGSVDTEINGQYTVGLVSGTYELYAEANGLTSDSQSVTVPPDISGVDFEILTDLYAGIVAYYPFNGNPHDLSGNENHGTVYGATLTEDMNGNPDNAYSFYDNDLIDCGASDSFSFDYDVTFAAWIKSEAMTGESTIFMKWESGREDKMLRLVNGKIKFYLYDTFNKEYLISNSTIPVDQWTHVAAVYDGSSASLYINGELDASKPASGNVSDWPYSRMYLGNTTPGRWANAQPFKGALDEMRIYNRALFDSEIEELCEFGFSFPVIEVTPESISETVSAGGSVTVPLTISNTSAEDLMFTISVEDTQESYVTTAEELYDGSHFVELPKGAEWISVFPESGSVVPGYVSQVTVTLDSEGLYAGEYNTILGVNHNDPSANNPITVPVTFVVEGVKYLSISPETYDFGSVWIGYNEIITVTLTNDGNEATTVNDISSDNSSIFTHDAVLPLAVPPFGEVTFNVTFVPEEENVYSGTFTIESNAEDNPVLTVELNGEGVELTLNDGLVAYYPLNGNANDESGNGFHGTIYGNPEIVEGVSGSAFSFDGVNDYIRAEDFYFQSREERSITFWAKVYPNTYAGQIISKHGGPANVEALMRFQEERYDVEWTIGNEFYDFTAIEPVNDVMASYDEFDFVAAVYDGYEIKLYVNNILFKAVNAQGLLTGENGFPLSFAASAAGTSSKSKVVIDEIRIYDRALSEPEIAELSDQDGDGILGYMDNCPNTPNGPDLGTCVRESGGIIIGTGVTCTDNSTCEIINEESYCQMEQGDINENGVGDVCECYADWNSDGIVSGADLDKFDAEYYQSPCDPEATNPVPPAPGCCYADGNNDTIVSTPDLDLFEAEYYQLCPYSNPCPNVPVP